MDQASALVFDATLERWLSFGTPKHVFSCQQIAEVIRVLHEVESAVKERDLWAVGWISYEAAPAFDASLEVNSDSPIPLAWFGLYEEPVVLTQVPLPTGTTKTSWQRLINETQYSEAFAAVHRHIAQGDSYQVNLSFRVQTDFSGSPYSLFYSMVEQQAGQHSFFIDSGRFVVCSASPELFFERDGDEIICRPMKGTAKRNADQDVDDANAIRLAASSKERAENVMIVDMVRNDVSRIAENASVHVTELFRIERYPGVFQMVSEVRAKTHATLPEIMEALFPSASITGAPKRRTMEIIKRLENSPRGLYTGTCGMLSPGGRASFNVAIRTAMVDRATSTAKYGVGSGIVWDSVCAGEYNECLLKANAVLGSTQQFALFETLRWEPQEGFWLVDHHLERMSASARYFGYSFNRSIVAKALEDAIQSATERDHPLRVKITLDPNGSISTSSSVCLPNQNAYRVALARFHVPSSNQLLLHKTADRSIYDNAVPVVADVDDVLLWNERGELTESRIANIVVTFEGVRYTPPLTSGLLPGCLRRDLLERGEIRERVILVRELAHADELHLINSVRGMWPVQVVHEGPCEEGR